MGVPYEFKPRERKALAGMAERFQAKFDTSGGVSVKETPEKFAFQVLLHAMRAIGWRNPSYAANYMRLPIEAFHPDRESVTVTRHRPSDGSVRWSGAAIRTWHSKAAADAIGLR